MEVLIYSTEEDLVVERREINNINNSKTVLAYALYASEDYKLRVKTTDIPSRRDEWVFKLVDKEKEGGGICPVDAVFGHEDRDVPYLIIDDGGENLHSAKGLERTITLNGEPGELDFRISATVTDCEMCDVFWLRIYLEKHDVLYQDYVLTQQEPLDYVQDMPIVLIRPQ
jgi:hypothetical protein